MAAKYVDGFVLPIRTKNLKKYEKMAKEASKVWKTFGAIDYYEAVLEDGKAKDMVPFPKLAGIKKGETVVFAWITYKSRKHRDQVNKKVHAYFAKKYSAADMAEGMPFDCSKMAYGGFDVIVKG